MARFIRAEKGPDVPPAHGGLVTPSHIPGVRAEGETTPLLWSTETPSAQRLPVCPFGPEMGQKIWAIFVNELQKKLFLSHRGSFSIF